MKRNAIAGWVLLSTARLLSGFGCTSDFSDCNDRRACPNAVGGAQSAGTAGTAGTGGAANSFAMSGAGGSDFESASLSGAGGSGSESASLSGVGGY